MTKKNQYNKSKIKAHISYMSKLLFLIVITQLLIAKIVAQDISNNDSTRQIFATDTIFSPSKQLDLIISLIDGFADSNPNKANEYALSAIELAEQLNDTTKIVSLLVGYGINENKLCNYEAADVAYQKAKEIVIISASENEKANLYYIIGSNFYDWSYYSESRSYYKLSIEKYTSLGNKAGVAKAFRGLSAIASNYGEYELAIGYMQRSRDIYTEIGDHNSLVTSILGLGVILENWGKTDKALTYYNQAYNHFKKEKNKLQEINLLLHIGDIYLKQQKYPIAIANYNHAIKIENTIHNKKLLSIGYSNLGETYFAINDYEKALSFQEKALAIKYEVGDKKRIAISLQSIGEIYFAMSEYKLAEENIRECLKISHELNLKEIEMEALLMLSIISKRNLDFQSSLRYLENYIKIKDEVFDNQSQKSVDDFYVKYEAKRIEKENELLNQKDATRALELKNEKETKYFAIVFLLFVIVIFFTIIIFINSRTRQAQRNFVLLSIKNKEITTQKEKLNELNKEFAHNKEQYRSIVENATTGMYQTLPNGYIKFANMSLIKMLGYTSFSELKNIDLNKEKRNRQIFIDLLNKNEIISGREDIWIKQDDSIMYVNESAWLVKDDEGNIVHYEGIVEDITKRKEAEFALEESRKELQRINSVLKGKNSEFEIAKNEAIEANEVKSLFIANVSHEIRTPMNSIIGFSTLLSSIITDKQQLSHVNAIKSSSKNLLAIINDVLDMSKIQAGEVDIIYEPISFFNLIEGIKQIFKLRIISKGIEFTTIIKDNFPSVVYLDKVRIRQILLNIIGNSLKFTDKGSIKVEVSESRKESDNIDLLISITDTGVGVPEDEQKIIFEAFKQGRVSPNGNEGGTGLGLSISNRLVKLMGGKLTLESEEGKGSKFTIHIPNVKVAIGESSQNILSMESIPFNIADNDEFTVKENIPTISKETQKELISIYKDKWEILCKSHIVNETVLFANELNAYATKKGELHLAKYCEALLFSLHNFEIDNINKLMIDLGQIFNINTSN
ncbi:MAG: tetratricopeptide repeat protein [Bacteroidota bacterium]